MHRSIVLLAVWTLLLVPVFCLGGILSHACGGHTEERCSHEDDCAVDPCSTSVRPSENVARDVADALCEALAVPQAFTAPLAAVFPLGECYWEGTRVADDGPPSRSLPLLI
ncbi:MAG: hypothetical protein ACKVU1_00895 [bacterium]